MPASAPTTPESAQNHRSPDRQQFCPIFLLKEEDSNLVFSGPDVSALPLAHTRKLGFFDLQVPALQSHDIDGGVFLLQKFPALRGIFRPHVRISKPRQICGALRPYIYSTS